MGSRQGRPPAGSRFRPSVPSFRPSSLSILGDMKRKNYRKTREELLVHILGRVRYEDECWIWEGATNARGYGEVGAIALVRSRPIGVHRAVYQIMVGEIEPGCELHHLCKRRACCNPDHLVPLTRREHRAAHYRERCWREHEPNWRIDKRGRRCCRTCDYERNRIRRSDPEKLDRLREQDRIRKRRKQRESSLTVRPLV